MTRAGFRFYALSMLDLDSLARARAAHLNETSQSWCDAIWSPAFQTLSKSMSDGEVEMLVDICPSAGHFSAVVAYLEKESASRAVTPFSILETDAQHAGVKPAEWIRVRFGAVK